MIASKRHVIDISNQGSLCVEQGNYGRATLLLKEAVNANKTLLHEIARLNNVRTVHREGEKLLRHVCKQSMLSSVAIDTSTDVRGFGYVYRTPMNIPTSLDFSDSEYEFHVSLAVIIVFNLALAHHLSGLDCEHNSAGRLDMFNKAISLYALLQQLLVQQHDVDSSTFLLLVSTNNIGQACKALGQSHEADLHFQRMLNMLLCLNDCQWGKKHNISLEGFFQNITHLVLKNAHTARAA